jgi:uncharacterized protein (DUF433 family)
MGVLARITQQPDVMGGKACIRGMRVTVSMVVSQIGAGHTVDEILADYPYLECEDIMQALRYAAWRTDEREVMATPDEATRRYEPIAASGDCAGQRRDRGGDWLLNFPCSGRH